MIRTDRTAELRNKGFPGRRLGPEQMTTDTAARVTRIVVQQGKRLDEIAYVDRPDIELPNGEGGAVNPNESVSMPFKYVKGADGKPVMPEVSARSARVEHLVGMAICLLMFHIGHGGATCQRHG